jgi:hypothetical protein
MKRTLLFTLAILAILGYSCKKETTETTPSSQPGFIQLKVGNYWVYEHYKVDTNGISTDLNSSDSIFILKDTLINGIKYYVSISTPFPNMYADTGYLRDSSGYLVSRLLDGRTGIGFATENFTDIFFSDTIDIIAIRVAKMTGKDSVVSVPVGTFTTRSMGRFLYPLAEGYPWGVRKYCNVYARGIGLIEYTNGFYNDPGHFEARLVRYRVE